MDMRAFVFCSVATALMTTAALVQAKGAVAPIRIAVVEEGVWAPHWFDVRSSKPGVAIELQREILREVGAPFLEKVFERVETAREAFRTGAVDAETASLNWLDQPIRDDSRFSAVFYETTDRIFALPAEPMLPAECALLGKAEIWGVVGYRYPCGAAGPLSRRVRDERALISGLADRSIPLAIIDEAAALWWSRKLDAPLAAGPFVGRTELRFRFREASDGFMDALNAAITRLLAQNRHEQIRSKYE